MKRLDGTAGGATGPGSSPSLANVIPEIGHFVANDRPSYQYLVESIRKFSNQEELVARMDKAGFELTKYSNLTGGIVAIHEGWKPLE